jgi:hypothetical protein
MGFYAYLWLREDGTPYYAGKGKGRRAFFGFGHGAIKCPRSRQRIVIYHVGSEAEVFDLETMLIAWFGRKDLGTGILRNKTNGGDQPPPRTGVRHSEETRRKMRESHAKRVRNPHSLETREKLAAAGRRRRQSAETKARISEGNRRRWAKVSFQDRQKQGAIMRGDFSYESAGHDSHTPSR